MGAETPDKAKPTKISSGPRIDVKPLKDAAGSKPAEKVAEVKADAANELDLAVSSTGKPQGYKEVDPTGGAVAKDAATVASSHPEASNQGRATGEEEDNEDEAADEAVQEDMLAAHHMPDLIEGAQPMFVSEHSQDSLTPNAAMKPQLSSATESEKQEEAAVVVKGPGKGSFNRGAPAQLDAKTPTNSALIPPVLSASRPNGTGRVRSVVTVPFGSNHAIFV